MAAKTSLRVGVILVLLHLFILNKSQSQNTRDFNREALEKSEKENRAREDKSKAEKSKNDNIEFNKKEREKTKIVGQHESMSFFLGTSPSSGQVKSGYVIKYPEDGKPFFGKYLANWNSTYSEWEIYRISFAPENHTILGYYVSSNQFGSSISLNDLYPFYPGKALLSTNEQLLGIEKFLAQKKSALSKADQSPRKNEENNQQREEYNRQRDAERQLEISQKNYMKGKDPYIDFSFGKLWGAKLDFKEYILSPDETFVAFFAVPTMETNNMILDKTPFNGKVYKIAFDKYDNYSIIELATYENLVPDLIKNEMRNDPFRFKIIERVVKEKFGMITPAERERLRKEQSLILNERIRKKEEENKRLEDKNQKQVNEGSQFLSLSQNNITYAGDIYKGVKYGMGIKTEANRVFHGLFIKDSPAFGVESGSDGVKRVYYESPLSNYSKNFYINSNGNISIQDTFRNVTQIFKNGDIYVGKPLSERQARGTRYYNNGDIYDGEFTDSLFEGRGFYYNSNGGMYEGLYKKGLKNGGGTLINVDGSATSTIFENGVRQKKSNNDSWKNRYGEIKYPSGDRFIGELSQGRAQGGYGKFYLSNGDVCYGDLVAGFRGIILKNDGRKIYGTFNFSSEQNNKVKISPSKDPSNRYNIIYPGSEMYFGYISDSSTKTGKGIYCYSNGDIYIGEFNDDLRNTKTGLLIYKNGDVFNGSFVNDKIEGPGEYLDAARKEKYSGNFKNGVRDGEGTLYFADGTSKKVRYINGVLQQ